MKPIHDGEYCGDFLCSRAVMDIDKCIERLQRELIVNENAAKAICHSAIKVLAEEPQVLKIISPVTVCGGIYGQFYDSKELFKTGREISNTKYLFLGNLVDRGY